MANDNTDVGPKVVWTFPLVRQFESDSGFLQLGSRIGSMIGSDGGMLSSGSVKERMSGNGVGSDSDESDIRSSASSAAESVQSEMESIQNEIDDIADSSDSVFKGSGDSSADYGQTTAQAVNGVVDIEDGVFVPQRLEVDVGDTVTWNNNDSEVHRVVAVRNGEFDSGQLEPGESFQHTFEEEAAVVYIDSIQGGDEMSGAILVGDAELEKNLPSSDDVKRVPFSNDTDSEGTRTMGEAADEKQEMRDDEMGFDNQ